jgi:hypothetical protein
MRGIDFFTIAVSYYLRSSLFSLFFLPILGTKLVILTVVCRCCRLLHFTPSGARGQALNSFLLHCFLLLLVLQTFSATHIREHLLGCAKGHIFLFCDSFFPCTWFRCFAGNTNRARMMAREKARTEPRNGGEIPQMAPVRGRVVRQCVFTRQLQDGKAVSVVFFWFMLDVNKAYMEPVVQARGSEVRDVWLWLPYNSIKALFSANFICVSITI